MKRIAVIGAGISGLTCAYELKKAGFKVDIYEKNSYVGGRMSTRVKDGFYFDIGADHLCNLYDEMKKDCKEFSIKWERMRFLSYHVARDGEIKPIGSVIGIISKLKLAYLYFKTKNFDFFNLSNNYKSDLDNGYDFAKEKVSKEFADYIVDSCSTTYQFHRSKAISQAAVVGMISFLKTEKKRWYLYRTKKGMSALPNALAKKLKVKTKYETKKIVSKKDHVDVDGRKYDIVVLATTAGITKKIYKNPSKEQENFLDSVKYSSSISVAYKVPTGTLGNKAVLWIPYLESKKISGIINEEMKGEDVILDGKTLLCSWLHEEFAKKITNKTDKEIFAIIKKEIARVTGLNESLLEDHDLERWAEAMPKFYQGYITGVKNFLEKGQGEKNVYFTGDYLNSPWVEGALRCGQRVAKKIIKDLS